MLRWAVETSRPGDIRANICPKSIQITVLHHWDSLSWVLSLEFVMNWMIWGSISAKLSQYRVNIWPNPSPASATEHHCLQLAWDGCDKLIEFKHRRPQLAEILDLKIAIWTSSTHLRNLHDLFRWCFESSTWVCLKIWKPQKLKLQHTVFYHISG